MPTTLRGPLFDGAYVGILARGEQAMEHDLSRAGVQRVHQRLNQVIKHKTGRYESHIIETTRGNGRAVTDGQMIYGPWLEGVGSRNKKSRFKGYWTFRMVGQGLGRDALSVARGSTQTMVRGLNGGN